MSYEDKSLIKGLADAHRGDALKASASLLRYGINTLHTAIDQLQSEASAHDSDEVRELLRTYLNATALHYDAIQSLRRVQR